MAASDRGYAQFGGSYDVDQGGFSGAPKFPRPSTFNFLLRYWARTDKGPALRMTLDTLRKMWAGGMYDHLGGGFHRYSVDAFWRVPHFEKMLYDQAQLVVSYLEAFQITEDRFFADVATDVLEYVLRDMTDPAGGFYSAEDADSAIDPAQPHEKEEGAFYMWTLDEIAEILDAETASAIVDAFGVSEIGNSISDPTGELGNRNVLYQALTAEQTAKQLERPEPEIAVALDHGKRVLLEARAKRPRPHLDDKIITAWNGLMISAFARASRVLDEPRFLAAATRAAEFIERELFDSRLWNTVAALSRWGGPASGPPGGLRLPRPGPSRSLRGRFREPLAGAGDTADRESEREVLGHRGWWFLRHLGR